MSSIEALHPRTRRTIERVRWGLLDDDDRAAIAVVHVDGVHATVHDARMGPSVPRARCATCGRGFAHCAGHFGVITLPVNVVPAHLCKRVVAVLGVVCVSTPFCKGVVRSAAHVCDTCGEVAPVVTPDAARSEFHLTWTRADAKKAKAKAKPKAKPKPTTRSDVLMNADDVRARFAALTARQVRAAGFHPVRAHPRALVWSRLLVLPPIARRYSKSAGAVVRADALTRAYEKVVALCAKYSASEAPVQRFVRDEIGRLVSLICDASAARSAEGQGSGQVKKGGAPGVVRFRSSAANARAAGRAGNDDFSVMNRLCGKEGRFRGTAVGGTTEHSGRAVITGDSSLLCDEVGVPECMAATLSVPARITAINAAEVARWFTKGHVTRVTTYEGASFEVKPGTKRPYKIRIGDFVHRKLRDWDVVYMNRQPTLWRQSIMAKYVRVVRGKSLRVAPSVVVAYNADFDGDEMNVHVPQTCEARAEAIEIMAVERCALSSQNAMPLVGLIMDAVVGVHLMCRRDALLDRAEAAQLMCASCSSPHDHAKLVEVVGIDTDGVFSCSCAEHARTFDLPPPAVFGRRPSGERVELWTGAQLVSRALPAGLWFDSGRPKQDGGDELDTDAWLVVQAGEFMCGSDAIGARTFGAKAGGFVDTVCKTLNARAALDMIDRTNFMAHAFVARRQVTMRVEDTCLPRESGALARAMRVEAGRAVMYAGRENCSRATLADLAAKRNRMQAVILERLERDACASAPENTLMLFARCGSKGSATNATSMAGCLGMQTIEGAPPRRAGAHGRSSLFARVDDHSARAHGWVASNFYAGLNVAEHVSHAMWTRAALIATGSKTRETGRAFRQLWSTLSGVVVAYDGTVRDAHGRVVQYAYGGTGFAIEAVTKRFSDQTVPYNTHTELARARAAPTFDDEVDADSAATEFLSLLEQIEAKGTAFVAQCARETVERELARGDFDGARCVAFARNVLARTEAARVAPGEPVGARAAECTAQPLTQKMLKTYHQSGETLREALGFAHISSVLTASVDRTCPIVTIPCADETRARDIMRRLAHIRVADVCKRARVDAFDDDDESYALDRAIYVAAYGSKRNSTTKRAKTQGGMTVAVVLSLDVAKLAARACTVHEVCAAVDVMLEGQIVVREHADVDALGRAATSSLRTIDVVIEVDDATRAAEVMARARAATIRGDPTFSSACEYDSKRNEVVLEAVASNVRACAQAYRRALREHRDATCSSVHATFRVLGAQAARNRIAHELSGALDENASANVHVLLLADVMMCRGAPLGVGSSGASSLGTGALSRMAFEKVRMVALSCARRGEDDACEETAARIILGAPIRVGTGAAFDVDVDHEMEMDNNVETANTNTTFSWSTFERPATYVPSTPEATYAPSYMIGTPIDDDDGPNYVPSSPIDHDTDGPSYVPNSPDYAPPHSSDDASSRALMRDLHSSPNS